MFELMYLCFRIPNASILRNNMKQHKKNQLLQNQHCAGFPDDVLCDFLQVSFGRLRSAMHPLLSLDFFDRDILLLDS